MGSGQEWGWAPSSGDCPGGCLWNKPLGWSVRAKEPGGTRTVHLGAWPAPPLWSLGGGWELPRPPRGQTTAPDPVNQAPKGQCPFRARGKRQAVPALGTNTRDQRSGWGSEGRGQKSEGDRGEQGGQLCRPGRPSLAFHPEQEGSQAGFCCCCCCCCFRAATSVYGNSQARG